MRPVIKRVKSCQFCKRGDSVPTISYKDATMLRALTTEKGKILPRRITGCCALHQRRVAAAVKRARHAAIVAFQEE